MEQALAQQPTSSEWQNLTFPFALRRASGVARAKKRILWRGTQVVREGPLSSYASVRVRPAPHQPSCSKASAYLMPEVLCQLASWCNAASWLVKDPLSPRPDGDPSGIGAQASWRPHPQSGHGRPDTDRQAHAWTVMGAIAQFEREIAIDNDSCECSSIHASRGARSEDDPGTSY